MLALESVGEAVYEHTTLTEQSSMFRSRCRTHLKDDVL